MINDIFFCLIGKVGGIFSESDNSFTINDTYSCVTNSEKDLLRKVGEIGYKYKVLKDFSNNYTDYFNEKLIESNSFLSENSQTNLNTSVYLTPICYSINEYLKIYEADIAELERAYYTNLNLTGSEIIGKLEHYIIKFEKLHNFLQVLNYKNMKGGSFLNYLFEQTINGDPEIKKVFRSLFVNTNKMLLNFITEWIINGSLNHEFFVVAANSYALQEKPENRSGYFDTLAMNSEISSWGANYYIEYANVPQYFPHNIAEDILFIGKALKILNSNKNSDDDKIPFNELAIFHRSLSKLSYIIFSDENTLNMINVDFLSKIITLIKTVTAKYLYKLVVNKNDVMSHLNAVKGIFLTFNGEFFFNFISKIKKLLNLPFDKRIENEINDVYFKNSLKEVFKIDSNPTNAKIYSNFKVKLISVGFNYDFQSSNVKVYIEKKEIFFLGSFAFETYTNKLRYMNTVYKNQGGALWNSASFDVDDDFTMSNTFTLKNFTKPANTFLSSNQNLEDFPTVSPNRGYLREQELLKSSIMKNRIQINDEMQVDEVERKLSLSYIMHVSKNFEFKNSQPLNLADLIHYFNFQFVIVYESTNNTNIKSITFTLRYVNRLKKIVLNNTDLGNTQTFKQISDYEIEIYSKKINENLDFLKNDNLASLNFSFHDNYCSVFNEHKTINFSFPFAINQLISKDKRKMTIGLLISSENLDVMLDISSWSFNFLSGEIYNEYSNLILINYNPVWPHNFIFNENVLKRYNLIFNLIFPLKINLVLLNELWIAKKNIGKKQNVLFGLIDSVHAEFMWYLQNLVSFFMFDIIQVKFKNFESKLKTCEDFEQIIKYHDEFLGEVISNSFVQSKKIMKIIFKILFTCRKFYNYMDNLMTNLYSAEMELHDYSNENAEVIKTSLTSLKAEFNERCEELISIFSKIKNSKYYSIITQLLTKLNYNQQRIIEHSHTNFD